MRIELGLFVVALGLASSALFAADSKPAGGADAQQAKSVLDFKLNDIDGKPVDLSKYKGKVLLIVNTASKCGHTPQYASLEKIYDQYKQQGFEVLAFPANEFRAQEPGTNAEIKEFCSSKYDVSFPLFSKIVVKGEGMHPLYQFITSSEKNPQTGGEIKWNFTKFLVDREGKIVQRFEPAVKPDDAKVTAAIETALAKKPSA
jgi:glutathione peroxidase